MDLLHVSISAKEPERVARFLAEILWGRALPFPPCPESWIAFSGREDGTAIEVYPINRVLTAGPDQLDFCAATANDESTFVHLALQTPLTAPEVLQAAAAEGWTARVCNRGPFECVEVWLEDRLLVEVLDPAMLRAYRSTMTSQKWADMFELELDETA